MSVKDLPSYVVNGKVYPVLYKGYVQSKRLKLRYTPDGLRILITGSKNFSQKRVNDFLENSALWLCRHQPTGIIPKRFVHGTVFPFFGEALTVHHHPFLRKSILKDGQILHVMCPATDINDYTLLWIKTQTKIYFQNLCDDLAQKIKVTLRSIKVGDPKTRWGSCQSQGKISLSWQLAFAPLAISRYVVVHELSHLIEMNHSAAFWNTVSMYDPKYQGHRKWLKQQGQTLHQWGH